MPKSEWKDTPLERVVEALEANGVGTALQYSDSADFVVRFVVAQIADLAEGWDRARVNGLLKDENAVKHKLIEADVGGFKRGVEWASNHAVVKFDELQKAAEEYRQDCIEELADKYVIRKLKEAAEIA